MNNLFKPSNKSKWGKSSSQKQYRRFAFTPNLTSQFLQAEFIYTEYQSFQDKWIYKINWTSNRKLRKNFFISAMGERKQMRGGHWIIRFPYLHQSITYKGIRYVQTKDILSPFLSNQFPENNLWTQPRHYKFTNAAAQIEASSPDKLRNGGEVAVNLLWSPGARQLNLKWSQQLKGGIARSNTVGRRQHITRYNCICYRHRSWRPEAAYLRLQLTHNRVYKLWGIRCWWKYTPSWLTLNYKYLL